MNESASYGQPAAPATSFNASFQSISARIDALQQERDARWKQVDEVHDRGLDLEELLDSRRRTKRVLERAGHRAAMSLNALHLRLSELRGKALAMSEEKESLSERKAIEEDTTPVLEPQSLFMACRVAVEAEALHNVIEGLSRRMQQRADEMRVLITQKKAEISALVQDALRRGNDDEILTLHSQVMALKSSIARIRADNARLETHYQERSRALSSCKTRTAEMGRKLADTEAAYIALTSPQG